MTQLDDDEEKHSRLGKLHLDKVLGSPIIAIVCNKIKVS